MKLEGNVHFRAKEWNEALVSYRTGLAYLPPRREYGKEKGKGRATEVDRLSDDEEDTIPEPVNSKSQENEVVGEELPVNNTLAECAKARAIMNANIGACHVKLVSFLGSC